ncbi:MAG: hypothetical protein INF93_12700 [Rhodobacter sp.]|nr:hypothetical protein [Rhodobacter sp.]
MKSTPFAKWVSALFLGLSCLFLAATAHAHAEFRGSLPVQDSLLDALPAEVRLEFSEQVGVLALTWRLPDGRGVEALGETGATSLTVPPPARGRAWYLCASLACGIGRRAPGGRIAGVFGGRGHGGRA